MTPGDLGAGRLALVAPLVNAIQGTSFKTVIIVSYITQYMTI